MQTVLEILQTVCKRVSLPVPTIAVSNPDPQVQQMLGLFEEVGKETLSRYSWQVATRRVTWTSLASESQGNIQTLWGVPLALIRNCTIWDGTLREPVYGPVSDEEYQNIKTFISAAPWPRYKIMADELLIWPVIAAGHDMSAMIKVKYWLTGDSGTIYRDRVIQDNDVPLLDDDMLTLGLKAKWKQEKGLPYAEDMRSFEGMCMDLAGRDGTKKTLSLDDGGYREPRPVILVPAGSWPLS